MKKILKIIISFLLSFGLILANFFNIYAFDTLQDALYETAKYLYESVENPKVSNLGGEWVILGLARSGYDVSDEYFQKYYENLEKYLIENDGILHEKRYTDYSRVILALTSIGKDPTNVLGYNLLEPLGDYSKTIWQGVNGPIWALIALDSGNYEIPLNPLAKIQATRDMYVDRILQFQLADGGFCLVENGSVNIDITGMALQALSKYQHRDDVKQAIDNAIEFLSSNQNSSGGYEVDGVESCETIVQVIVALCELGISLDDERFIKNGNSMFDYLMKYYLKGSGFKHILDDDSPNQLATEQGFYGLVSLSRFINEKSSLYNMSDSLNLEFSEKVDLVGLTGKNEDVKISLIVEELKTFSDILGSFSKDAIEELAIRNIINGNDKNLFEPNKTMTRAEFTTIIVRALGLPLSEEEIFDDIFESQWFFPYVSTAYNYGIVSGFTEKTFNPYGTITREEAFSMIARASSLCGMDTHMQDNQVKDILATFTDYIKVSQWAKESVAFCYYVGIASNDDIEILPKQQVTKEEIAQMVYNMLKIAKLL